MMHSSNLSASSDSSDNDFVAPPRRLGYEDFDHSAFSSRLSDDSDEEKEEEVHISKFQLSSSSLNSSRDGDKKATKSKNRDSKGNDTGNTSNSMKRIKFTSSRDNESQNNAFSYGVNMSKLDDYDEVHHNSFRKSEDTMKSKKMRYQAEGSSLNKPLGQENKGRSLMEKMGFKIGEGLGKHSQGIVDPIQPSKQKGRGGFGMSFPELEEALARYNPDDEVVQLVEEKSWLENEDLDTMDLDVLRSWTEEGEKDLDVEKMTDFCNPDIVSGVVNSKNVFDKLEGVEMRKARARSNPFETISGGIFLNRAAMKMANMDSAFDYMFTNPLDETGHPMVGKNDLLYFADVCAGPGGFSEYVLWRKRWRAKGFGFTLKGDNDFKLQDFFAGGCETFEAYYGTKDDGNIFDPENILSLTDFIMKATDDKGVHFMMADGGFSVAGKENLQEILSKQLYLTQFLVALSIVRTGGHFLCKVFDLFTPFSAGLIYLMYRSFKKICIFKPNTSRPANSERYIICKWKRPDCYPIRQYMFELNERLWEINGNSDIDINFCVPMIELRSDPFFNYLMESNNKLGSRQITALVKIAAFFNDDELVEKKQSELRRNSLALWKVPDQIRKLDRTTVEEAIPKIAPSNPSALSFRGLNLDPENLKKTFFSIYDWNCVVLGCLQKTDLSFYLGLGRKLYRMSPSGRWVVEHPYFALPSGTLIFGEKVPELKGEGGAQKKLNTLHIIDIVAIGYEKISECHYNERIEQGMLLELALKKWGPSELGPVRVIRATPLEGVDQIIKGLTFRYAKSNSCQLVVEVDDSFYVPKGIVFFNTTKPPYTRYISKSTGYYYYDKPGGQSKYERDRPEEANASVRDCMERQKLWWWEDGVGFYQEEPKKGVLHKDTLIKFVQSHLIR